MMVFSEIFYYSNYYGLTRKYFHGDFNIPYILNTSNLHMKTIIKQHSHRRCIYLIMFMHLLRVCVDITCSVHFLKTGYHLCLDYCASICGGLDKLFPGCLTLCSHCMAWGGGVLHQCPQAVWKSWASTTQTGQHLYNIHIFQHHCTNRCYRPFIFILCKCTAAYFVSRIT